jgi:hypothetical protein
MNGPVTILVAASLGLAAGAGITVAMVPERTVTVTETAVRDVTDPTAYERGLTDGLNAAEVNADDRMADAYQAGQDYADEAWRQALLGCQEDEAFTADRECVAMDDADFTATEGWVTR